MGEELKIKEEINKVIKKKIEDCQATETVKKFLNELLNIEIEHAYERSSWWGRSDIYEKLIRKYASNSRGDAQ